jgi:quinol-cytochrome oxidoreductase complex cytochrome b subunit
MTRTPRSLLWRAPESPLPKHPYRDTLLVYGGLALLIVVLAWVTGGSVGKAIVVSAFFYVAASAWSLLRVRRRIRAEAAVRGRGL